MRNLKTLVSRRNVLLRYSKIVGIYQEHIETGLPATWILRNYIQPVYPISYRTLMNILSIPVNRELKEVEAEIQQLRDANGKFTPRNINKSKHTNE